MTEKRLEEAINASNRGNTRFIKGHEIREGFGHLERGFLSQACT